MNITMLACGLLAALLAAPTATGQGPDLRILILPSHDQGLQADLSKEVAERLTTGLTRAGITVVDQAHAEILEERGRQIFANFLGKQGEGSNPEMELGALAAADLVVRVGVAVERQVQQQGRYRVQQRLRIRLLAADDPGISWNETFEATGQSLDSYASAHRAALDSMTKAEDETSAISRLNKILAAIQEEERKNGSLFTVGVYSDREDPEFSALMSEGLTGLSETVEGSVQQVRSGVAASDQGARRAFAEFTLRYRGNAAGLQSALLKIVRQAPTAEGHVHDAAFLSSRRRLDLIIRTRKPETSLAKEVEKVVQGAVQNLFDANQDYLTGKQVSVLPTSIPSARGLRAEMDSMAQSVWNEQKRIEGQLAREQGGEAPDAMSVGPVTIRGKTYGTLREAQDAAREAVKQYYLSKPGTLATEISRLVGQALEASSDKKTKVLIGDDEQSVALDVVKREAEIYREEGAIDPNTIAFLQRPGTHAVVLSSLGEMLSTYQLNVTVIDLNTGVALRHVSFLPESFRAELDQALTER